MLKFEDELKLIQGLNKSTGKDVGVYVEVKEPAFHAREGKDITKAVIDMLDKSMATTARMPNPSCRFLTMTRSRPRATRAGRANWPCW